MGLCGSGTLWIAGECLYLCLSKCQHYVPYKQFKIYRFKQVYGALCKPNHHKMYRYWEMHVKILRIIWMWIQGASTTIHIFFNSYQSKNLHRWFKILWKKYIPKTQIQGVSSHRCLYQKKKVTSVNFYFTFPRKIFLLFKLHVSILFQIKSI